MVIDCDRGMPFVMAHPDSEAAKPFKKIAERTKEYTGFKETLKEKEMEKFPHHFQKPQA
jgi:MinD-like ATPase involved in chromosome partitioning or flagellar assembly